jgi:hypothetical protein
MEEVESGWRISRVENESHIFCYNQVVAIVEFPDMSEYDRQDPEHSVLTEIGRLRHDNKYLSERVSNLEGFKKKFFEVQRELTLTRDQLLISMEQLNLARWKSRIEVATDNQGSAEAESGSNEDLIRFFHESFIAGSYRDLFDAVFHAVQSCDLDLLVQVRYHNKAINFSTDEEHKHIALDLIESHGLEKEVIEAGPCMIINHRYLTMVVCGLPLTRAGGAEHLKEYLEIIAAGANVRVDTLAKKLELDELQENIYKIFRKVNHSFEDIQNNLDNQIIAISEMFLGFEKDMRDKIAELGLTHTQGKSIYQVIAAAKAELNLMLTSSLTVDEDFVAVMKRLELAYAPRKPKL